MDSPKVFVVTINWNGLADTLECLESLSVLDHKNFVAVVVDNGSESSQADQIEQRFPDAVVLRQNENLGFCGGCNAGIRYALENGADYVLLLNNDALATQTLLTKLLKVFALFPDAGAVSPVVCEYPNTSKIWYCRPRWLAGKAYFLLKEIDDAPESLLGQETFPVLFATGCCMLVPTRVFKTAGLLDERYFAYYDEAEWCCRIRKLGFSSYVVPDAIAYHKERGSTPGPVHAYLTSRNRLLWMKEYLPLRERLRSTSYLGKEWIWHTLNAGGLMRDRGGVSRIVSRAIAFGYADYFRGRFYKWDSRIFKNSQDSKDEYPDSLSHLR